MYACRSFWPELEVFKTGSFESWNQYFSCGNSRHAARKSVVTTTVCSVCEAAESVNSSIFVEFTVRGWKLQVNREVEAVDERGRTQTGRYISRHIASSQLAPSPLCRESNWDNYTTRKPPGYTTVCLTGYASANKGTDSCGLTKIRQAPADPPTVAIAVHSSLIAALRKRSSQ